MALTPIDVLCAHCIPFVHPTEVSEVDFVESITIFDCPGIDESQVVVCHNSIHYILGNYDPNKTHCQFTAGEKRDISAQDVWRRRDEFWHKQRLAENDDELPKFGNCQVIGGSRSVIFSDERETLLRVVKVFDIAGNESDVSAQLSLLGISRYPTLKAGRAESQGGEEHSESLKPRGPAFLNRVSLDKERDESFTPCALSFLSAASLFIGLWRGILGGGGWRWPLNAGLVVLGWFGQVTYPLINYL
jgi:hypothetical protein